MTSEWRAGMESVISRHAWSACTLARLCADWASARRAVHTRTSSRADATLSVASLLRALLSRSCDSANATVDEEMTYSARSLERPASRYADTNWASELEDGRTRSTTA